MQRNQVRVIVSMSSLFMITTLARSQNFVPDNWKSTRFDATATPAHREMAAALIWHQGIQNWEAYAAATSAALGDVDWNGVVDGMDVVLIQSRDGENCAYKEGPMYELLRRGDVNMDTEINEKDALYATAHAGTLTYVNGFEFLLGMLAMSPPTIPGTDIPVWPGRDLHSQAFSDVWTENEHGMTMSAAWPRNHEFSISSGWTPAPHGAIASSGWSNPYAPINHQKDQTRMWPGNHVASFSTSWRQIHNATTSNYTERDHTRALSSSWVPNHDRSVSDTWISHVASSSQMWAPSHNPTTSAAGDPSVHSASISATWNPVHGQATSTQRWPGNHIFHPSAGWGSHSLGSSSANWPSGHYASISQSWGPNPHTGWPANHSFDMSSTWGQPDPSHSIVETAQKIKDAIPGTGQQ